MRLCSLFFDCYSYKFIILFGVANNDNDCILYDVIINTGASLRKNSCLLEHVDKQDDGILYLIPGSAYHACTIESKY